MTTWTRRGGACWVAGDRQLDITNNRRQVALALWKMRSWAQEGRLDHVYDHCPHQGGHTLGRPYESVASQDLAPGDRRQRQETVGGRGSRFPHPGRGNFGTTGVLGADW